MGLSAEGANWFAETVEKLTPRCTGVIKTAFSPFVNVAGYMAQDGKKDWKGFARSAWGGTGDGLTDFTIGEGKNAVTLNGTEMAKTAGGLGLGYRFLSGGGAYRDKDGNTDIAGIPFV